jgi:polar amino acid transport system substrate-binding protein
MHSIASIALAVAALSWQAEPVTVPPSDPDTAPASATAAHFGERVGRSLQIGGSLPEPSRDAPLRVGICDLPPWSIPPSPRTDYWSGLAAVVWRQTVRELALDYSISSMGYTDLLQALERGEVDVGITGIPIVPENLVRFTLTPPFDQTGLSIATRVRDTLSVDAVLTRMLHSEVVTWLLVLFGFALAFAVGFWALERRRNPPLEGSVARGLAESAWWSFTTLSTVGYGDRVPVTMRGRTLGALWMALGFVLMTISAAVVTSVLTVERLTPVVRGAADLARSRNGVMRGTLSEAYLAEARVPSTAFDTMEAAVAALANGKVDAVVGPTATLVYLVERADRHGMAVLPRPLMREFVGLGMRFGLDPALEKRIELEVVKAAESGEYRTFRAAMLGTADAVTDLPPPRGDAQEP